MNRLLASIVVPRRTCAFVQRHAGAAVTVGVAAIAALVLWRDDLPHPFTLFSFAAIAVTFLVRGNGTRFTRRHSLMLPPKFLLYTPERRRSSMGFLSHYLWSLRLSRELVQLIAHSRRTVAFRST